MKFLLPALLLPATVASAAEDAISARAMALGGVRSALPFDNVAVSGNPGLLGLHERFDMGGLLGFGPSAGLHWGVTALDARTTSFLALGLSYTGDAYDTPFRDHEIPGWTEVGIEPTNKKRYHDVSLGIAVPIPSRRVSFGVGSTWSFFDHDVQGQGSAADLNMGVGFRPIDLMVAGLSARNVLPGDATDDRPMQFLGGTSVGVGTPFLATAEAGWQDGSDTPWSAGGGIAGTIETLAIRAGTRWDGPTTETRLTTGLALTNQSAEMAYGLAIPLGAGKATAAGMAHVLSFQVSAPDMR